MTTASQAPVTKKCTKCGRDLPLESFSKDKKYKSGLDNRCRDCIKTYNDNYRSTHPSRSTSWRREWIAKSGPDEITAFYRKGNLGRYGLSPDQYDEKVLNQGGTCAICGELPTVNKDKKKQKLFVEHNHFTGKVRSLACHGCNSAIGFMKESPERLRAAADYLERHAALENKN